MGAGKRTIQRRRPQRHEQLSIATSSPPFPLHIALCPHYLSHSALSALLYVAVPPPFLAARCKTCSPLYTPSVSSLFALQHVSLERNWPGRIRSSCVAIVRTESRDLESNDARCGERGRNILFISHLKSLAPQTRCVSSAARNRLQTRTVALPFVSQFRLGTLQLERD
jgi:hypothetical protein